MGTVRRVRPIPQSRLGGQRYCCTGYRSAPGQVYHRPVIPFRVQRPAPGSKAAAGSGPDAILVPLPKLEFAKCGLTRWRCELGR